MKQIFTLLVALICSTVMLAQTPAQEMTNSLFKGTATANVLNKDYSLTDQTAEFTINASDNKTIDLKFSDVSITAKILFTTYTLTVKDIATSGLEVTKNGNTYSISDKQFGVTFASGENSKVVQASVKSSTIDIQNKKATLTLNFTDLPNAMQSLGIKSLDVKYTLTLDKLSPVSGLNNISVDEQKADGKYLKDGKVVILNKGVEYNVNGVKLQ